MRTCEWLCIGGPLDGKQRVAMAAGYHYGTLAPRDKKFEYVTQDSVEREWPPSPIGPPVHRHMYRAREYQYPNGQREFVFVHDNLSEDEADGLLNERFVGRARKEE